MGVSMALAIDVAANMIAAGIGGIIIYFGKENLLPVIRGKLRNLPRLNGTVWQREQDKPGVHSVMKIKQSGSVITAEVSRQGDTTPRSFAYRGEISGHQIVLSWNDSASREQLIGAMVLHLSADLTRLEGYTSYFRHNDGRVVAVPCFYRRTATP